MVIGYLGEKDQFGWWQSSFFTKGSDAFLSPLFSRTKILAQCNGVTHAAALVHDERIGVGHVYHLFRLPEDIEQTIHQVLHGTDFEKAILKIVANKDAALGYLRKQSLGINSATVGPIRVGKIESLRDYKSWRLSASYYVYAFEKGEPIFPYYSDIS